MSSSAPIKLEGAAINLGLRLLKVNDAAVVLNAGTPVFEGEYLTGVSLQELEGR